MIFSLDVRRARKGDCLIIHYGTKADPGLVLIDGGPSNVYTPHLKPRLAEIRKARGLGSNEPLLVDLAMVSHIDDDHINGILELTKELREALDAQQPLPLKLRSFWHNSFDDIIGNNPKELVAAVLASFGTASLSGETDTEGLDPATARVLASVGQGFRLRDDIKRINDELKSQFKLNSEFKGKLVMSQKKPLDLGKGLKITVVGPMKKELLALQKEHDTFLKEQAKNKKTKAVTAAFTDDSAANLSSLVLLAEVGTKRILLTGDARGDKVLEGLEQLGLLKKDGKDSIHVDILKMPHHGSDRNVDAIFFRRITADHYVFSGDGEHGNPERATFEMLLAENGKGNFTIHLTYPIDEIDVGRKDDWQKEQKKEKDRGKKDVRENWSPKKHSLKAFFAAHPEIAKQTSIISGHGDPHVINLFDKIGF
jgi:beta-lactamase superfamily II metal-dependent hydrolase